MVRGYHAGMLKTVEALIEAGIEGGLHLGGQVVVSRGGEVVEELVVGASAAGRAMRGDEIVLWMSSGKPITAAAVMQLVERGEVGLDEPVAAYLPTFAAHGKEAVTVRHLLTHTGGFRTARFKFPRDDWGTIIAAICDAEPEWEAGEQGGYHTQTSWFILGELVRLVDGRAIERYVREEVFLPLGMEDSWVGMPPGTYNGYEQAGRLMAMPITSVGRFAENDKVTATWNTRPRPGGNGMGPVRELVRFYEMLLGGGERDGVRVLKSETVATMTSRQRTGMVDQTFMQEVDWGLGLAINSAHLQAQTPNGPAWHRVPYGYGPYASRDTFGHGGAQSSVFFADPGYGLAVGIVFNGMPGEAKHHMRVNAVLEGLYEDLGLVGG